MTNKKKMELHDFINYSVKEGILDPDMVAKWDYLKKLGYFNQSEAWVNDNEGEDE